MEVFTCIEIPVKALTSGIYIQVTSDVLKKESAINDLAT